MTTTADHEVGKARTRAQQHGSKVLRIVKGGRDWLPHLKAIEQRDIRLFQIALVALLGVLVIGASVGGVVAAFLGMGWTHAFSRS